MGASKFLQKKANTRAKEIDKKYGEGQYGGTWWQDMVKNNAEEGESPSESFLQRKMKEISSARTVKPESTQDVVSGSGAKKGNRVVGSPGGTALGGFSYTGKKRREKTAQELEAEKEAQVQAYEEYVRLATLDLNAQEKAISEAKEKAAKSRPKYNIHAFGGYDDIQTEEEKNYSKLLADLNKAKSIQYDIKGRKELDALTAEQTDALGRLSKASGTQTAVMATNQAREAAADKAEGELMASGLSDEKIRELLGYYKNIPKREKNAELYEEMQQAGEAYAETNPGLATVTSVGTNLVSGIGAIKTALDKAIDPNTPVDYHGGAFLPYAYTSGVRNTVSKNLETDYGKGASFAYGVGTSMLESAATVGLTMAGVPAWLATSTLGGAAATAAMQEAKDRGLDDNRAIWTGLLAGAAETAFEKISLESLITMKAPTGTMRQRILGTIKNTAKQAGIEGSEEVFTDFANLIADGIVNGDLSQVQQTISGYIDDGMTEQEARNKAVGEWLKDTAVDFTAGALAGGIMGGGANALSRSSQKAEIKREYTGREQELIDKSKELLPDNQEAEKLRSKMQSKLGSKRGLTGGDIEKLLQSNVDAPFVSDVDKITAAVKNQLELYGESGNTDLIASAVTKRLLRENESGKETDAFVNSKYGQRVLNELNPENFDGENRTADDKPRALFNSEWAGKIGTKVFAPEVFSRDVGVTGAKYNAETGKLDAIVKDDVGKIQTVPAEKAELSPLQEELFDWAADLGEAGPVLVSAYRQTQNLETYARQFHNAYEYGKAGVPMDYVNKSQAVSDLNTTQREIAYEEGAKAHQRELQGRQEKKRSGGTVDSTTKKKPTVSLRGATVGGVKYAAVNKKAMDGRQWASVGTMKAFAQATGVNVVFYESQANERGEYEGANGFYKDGTLYLDINAGRDRVAMGETAILKTAAHEITHYIKEGSPEQYEVLKNFVVSKLTREKDLSFDDLVTDKQRREPGLSYEEAVDEVVADACEMMLKDSKAVEQLARENRSLAERIRQWIRKWVRSLKAAMEGLTADRPESRAMMQYAQELQEIWDNALVDAARNGRGTMRENAPAEVKQQARVGTSESIKPDEKSLKGKRDDGKMDAVKDLLKEDLDSGEERKEDRGAFLRRATGEGLRIFEGDSIAYGYRTVPWGSAGENARQVQKELTALGIDAEITEGYVHWNLNGISSRRAISQAVTIEKRKVLISNRVSLPSKNAAGHEAFHFWGSTQAREAYADELSENLNFSSKEFVEYQAVIAEAYLGGEADLSDSTQLQKLREELFAYISGDIHEGVNDDLLRPMFRDYDAVKAAWVKLCKDRDGGKVQNQQREPRLSDRAVLEWAAEMALRDKSKSWTAEDREQLERFRNRMRMLQDTQAELEALKEERKILLAGRKVSEITGEERTEVTKNKNRIDIAKNKAERYEAAVWELESKAAIKTLLRKSRSIVETEASNQARREYRERQEEREMVNVTRRKVERNAKRLLEYMNTNTDKKHIPEALKKPIGELLESLNFYSNSARRGGYTSRADLKYYEAMQGLQAALATQRAFDDTGEGTDVFKGYLDLPAGFESLLAVHVQRVKDVVEKHPLKTDVLKMMDLGDLRDLDVILSVMSRSVTKMNEMFIKRRFAYVADAAEDSIFAMQRLGQHQDKPGERFALWDNTLPWYAFQRFGEGGKAVFEGLQDGWDKLAFNMKTILDFRQGLISDDQARKWDTETHKVELTDPDGSKVTATLTTAQLMSLYCLSKRKQALGHLLGGGIRPDAIEVTNTLGDKIKKKKLNQDKQFKLTEESLGQMLKLLTPEQIKVADAMQKFMTEQGSTWGNAISMERFGYRAFTEQNYFPIETDRQDREAKTGDAKEGSLYRLQNISAVKPLVKNANNALILRGIFDVFANHTADMAKYNALVLPIIDAQKWYNYRYGEKNEAGQVYTRTVQRAMTKAYGEVANNFVITFLRDLNGVKESSDRGTSKAERATSFYKRTAVAANLRVALLQPTAYVRASLALDYKYLAKAFLDKTSTAQAKKEMLENSGIALWKSLGFFDTDVGRSIRDQIKGKSSKIEDLVDKTMVPAEKGDEVTWARLWRACKLEVQDKQHMTGEELLKATAERFREVIYQTQVVDSTMTRSHNMRAGSEWAKTVTAFMSEPTVSYNMVMESTRKTAEDAKRMGMRVAVKRNGKTLVRAFQAYVLTEVASAIVESLTDAFRDPDDDPFPEKFWTAFWGEKPESFRDAVLGIVLGTNGNLVGNLNLLGKIPLLKDALSALSGDDVSRMDMEALTNTYKALAIWDETIRLENGSLDKATKTTYYGNMTPYGKLYQTSKALSQLTGLPASAAMREVATAWNTTVGAAWPAMKMRTYEDKKLREAWQKYGKDSGVSYATVYRAIQDMKEFESDRDADGNAISGSLKAKYVEYIRGLGLTRAQEKAVWEAAKNSSWSDKGTPWG